VTSLFDLPFENDDDTERAPDPTQPPPAPVHPAPPPAPERRAAGDAAHATGPRIYTVRQLTALLRARIEDAFPRVWVEGELADCRSCRAATCTSA